jgi:peptide/nickel transport system permease protein
MGRYLARRTAHAVLLLAGVSVLSFLMLAMAPGDFFDDVRLNPQISTATVDAIRARYGLNQPLPLRYLHWLSSAALGDFGVSFAYNAPAASLLWPRARNTLMLAVPALLLAWLTALSAGTWSAARRGGLVDRAAALASSVLIAVPEVVLASFVLLAAARSGLLARGGAATAPWIKAVLVLGAGSAPVLLRHVRSAMAGAFDSPGVTAARAHGVAETRLWIRHVLPLAANPLISLFGLSFAGLLSSSLLVEVIVGWPGLGPMLVDAIAARDVYLILGPVMLSAIFLVGGNLLADLLLLVVDPRVRAE